MLAMCLVSELPEHGRAQSQARLAHPLARCLSCVASVRLLFWLLLHRTGSPVTENWVGLALAVAGPLRGYSEDECVPGSRAHCPPGRSMEKAHAQGGDQLLRGLQLLGGLCTRLGD